MINKKIIGSLFPLTIDSIVKIWFFGFLCPLIMFKSLIFIINLVNK